MMRIFHYFIGTVIGIGYFPMAPGTAGSFVAILMFWFIPFNLPAQLIFLVIIFFIGVWSASFIETEQGNDPGIVVVDELVGQGVALILIPSQIIYYAAAFVLFRIFDIFKPFPIKKFEHFPGGWGIMADDVVAGIYANIVLQIILVLGLFK